MSKKIKITVKLNRARNVVAASLASGAFQPRIVRDKSRYRRQDYKKSSRDD